MAHKKGQGSVRNGRDSVSKRLGIKKFGSEAVIDPSSTWQLPRAWDPGLARRSPSA